jgi:transcriptional regulator
MYGRDTSREERPEVLHEAIRAIRFGTLIVSDDTGRPQAVSIPMVLKTDAAGVRLEGHVARANPIWKLWPRPALVLFQGPQAYVRPGWYPAKQEHGKVVPTWAYVMIEARGAITELADMTETLTHVRELSEQQEEGQEKPWSVDDAPAGYISALARGIVAFRIPCEELSGVWKLNQHRSEDDRNGMSDGFSGRGDADSAALAAIMRDAGWARQA